MILSWLCRFKCLLFVISIHSWTTVGFTMTWLTMVQMLVSHDNGPNIETALGEFPVFVGYLLVEGVG